MQQSFYTIKEQMTNELVEKKSRFIANVFYVEDEVAANQKIEEVRKVNREARHNVYAYRLENGLEKYSDDGEPSGTAGVPILDILRGEKLVNVLIVVTRYFGGILLGTGGLVRSYGGVAKLALENANKMEMKLCTEFQISFCYDSYNRILYYCKNHDVMILETNFLENVEMKVLVIDSYTSQFLHDLSEITNRTAHYDEIKKCYHE